MKYAIVSVSKTGTRCGAKVKAGIWVMEPCMKERDRKVVR